MKLINLELGKVRGLISSAILPSLSTGKGGIYISDAWFEPGSSRPPVREVAFSASPFSEDDICPDREVEQGVNRKDCHTPFRKSVCS